MTCRVYSGYMSSYLVVQPSRLLPSWLRPSSGTYAWCVCLASFPGAHWCMLSLEPVQLASQAVFLFWFFPHPIPCSDYVLWEEQTQDVRIVSLFVLPLDITRLILQEGRRKHWAGYLGEEL